MVKEFILNLSQMVSALTIIIVALMKIEKWSKGKISAWLLKPIFERFTSIDNQMKETNSKLSKLEMDNLKLIIMSDEIPLMERLQAGERYVELGGNSVIKIHYNELKRQYENTIKKEG